jgi:prepilin peptidase CpaA
MSSYWRQWARLLVPQMVFYSFIWMALVGGVLAILLIAYKKAFGQTLQNLKLLLMGWLLQAHTEDANLTIKNQALLKLPYGVAIALGTILAVFLRQIPQFGF